MNTEFKNQTRINTLGKPVTEMLSEVMRGVKSVKEVEGKLEMYKIDTPIHLAIYPGSFNPPHYGHIKVAEEVLNILKTNKKLVGKEKTVWLDMTHNNKKDNDKFREDRFEMTKLALVNMEDIYATNIQSFLDNPDGPEYFQILKKISGGNKGSVTWVMGSDVIKGMMSYWPDNGKLLLKEIDGIIVMCRSEEGKDVNTTCEDLKTRLLTFISNPEDGLGKLIVDVKPLEFSDRSSSKLIKKTCNLFKETNEVEKQKIRKDILDDTPKSVLNYIEKKQYMKSKCYGRINNNKPRTGIKEHLMFKRMLVSHWIGKLVRDEIPGRPTHDIISDKEKREKRKREKIRLKEFIRNPYSDPYYTRASGDAQDYLMRYAKHGLGKIMSGRGKTKKTQKKRGRRKTHKLKKRRKKKTRK